MRGIPGSAVLLSLLLLGACHSPRVATQPAGATAPESGTARPSGYGRLTILGTGGPLGYVGDVMNKVRLVSVDGTVYRRLTRRVRVPAGRHVVVVDWTGYEIPEDVAWYTNSGQQTAAWCRSGSERLTFTVEVEARKRYELDWPAYDEPGPPEGLVEAE